MVGMTKTLSLGLSQVFSVNHFVCKQYALLRISCLSMGLIVSAYGVAQEPVTLTPAEQAAQAQVAASDFAQMVALCRHTILYGPVEEKTRLLATLGDRTCEESASEALAIESSVE